MTSYLTDFWRRRRRALGITAGVIGGIYLAGKYALSKFQEAQMRIMADQAAQENLKRRFKQNQEDCSFTVQALLPSLSEQLMEAMDVDARTSALQALAQKKASAPPSQMTDSRMSAFEQVEKPQDLSASAQSDNDHPGFASAPEAIPLPDPAREAEELRMAEEAKAAAEAREAEEKAQLPTQSKGELWAEIKMLSLARSIASMYLLALLVLQTHVQLNLIGRYKYLGSLVDEAEKEQAREKSGVQGRMGGSDSPKGKEDRSTRGGVDAETEVQFLTFSWWLLNEGWKDVVERVQSGVEQVFESISLKTILTPTELSKRLREVRALVEGEGDGARHSFASSLLPPDVAAETLVLTQAGSSTTVSSQLRSLLDETADILDSPDFTHVFQIVLDRLFDTFTSTLQEQAFQDPPLPQGDFQHPLAKFEEMHEKTARLVDLLPASARESRSVMLDLPNRYLESLADVRELSELSAVVFCVQQKGEWQS